MLDEFIIDGDTLKKYNGIEVIIPDGVVKIKDEAFDRCSNVLSIVMPNSVTTIGKSAFDYCSRLTCINIPESVTAIGQYAFMNCRALVSVTIPGGVTAIADSTFQSCYSLASVEIPDSVITIGKRAFSNCNAIESLTIPESVQAIGEDAFSGCNSLKSLALPVGILTGGKLGILGIPENAEVSCSSSLYKGCLPSEILDTDMRNIKMAAAMLYCENSKLFHPEDCGKFEQYISRQRGRIINKIIQTERMGAIAYFVNHGFITVNNIDLYIEKANSSRKQQVLAFLLNIKNTGYSRAEIEVAEEKRLRCELECDPNSVTELKKTWGVANNDDGTCRITSYKGTDTKIIIPAKIGERPVKEIAKRMSSRGNLKNVESIVISAGVTTIGDLAFENCSRLRTVVFPDSVTELNGLWNYNGVFEGCDKSLLTIYASKGSGIEGNAKHAGFNFEELTK
jgi:hypothetical protein